MKDTLFSTLEIQGNIAILTQSTKANRTCRAKKLSDTEYVNLTTGEICEYEKKSKNRSQSQRSLLRTFAKIRGIVNANATDPTKVKFITLTYEDPEDDPKELYRDFSAFWKRFVRWSLKEGLEKPEYLVVCEPNAACENEDEKQRFHFHLLLFYEDKAPFLRKKKIDELWENGVTWVSKVDEVTNLGAYLSAYLSDVVIEEEIEGELSKKSVIKGGRLHLYPPNFNIYRCSRGVKRPIKKQISEIEALRYRHTHKSTFSTKRTIKNEKAGFETTVYREWFDISEDSFQQGEKPTE